MHKNIVSAALATIIAATPFSMGAQETNWKNLPPSQRHSPGHVEIPADRHDPARKINMLTVIKTNNYVQHHDGTMEYVNTHRYGEIFVLPVENIKEASLSMGGDPRAPKEQFITYLDYRSHFFEGGYFKDFAAMEEAVGGEEYTFEIEYTDGEKTSNMVRFPEGGKEPGPVKMSIHQDGQEIGYDDIDYTKDLIVRWENYQGQNDPNGIVDDLVTIMVNRCGENRKRVYVSGVPTLNATYLTHEANEAIIPAETLEAGNWYWIAGEFSNHVHTTVADGAPALSAWMNSVILDVATTGASEESVCTESMQRFD